MNKRMIVLSLLLASACSKEPATEADRPVTVIAGAVTTKADAPATAMLATAAAKAPETPHDQPKLLSVTESAQIHTSEMWSEPIAPTG